MTLIHGLEIMGACLVTGVAGFCLGYITKWAVDKY